MLKEENEALIEAKQTLEEERVRKRLREQEVLRENMFQQKSVQRENREREL